MTIIDMVMMIAGRLLLNPEYTNINAAEVDMHIVRALLTIRSRPEFSSMGIRKCIRAVTAATGKSSLVLPPNMKHRQDIATTLPRSTMRSL